MSSSFRNFTLTSIFLFTAFGSCANGQAPASNSVDRAFPDNVYWGDTHIHTNLSIDAFLTGNRLLGAEEAYRFARGETITLHNGATARLRRPLDFAVVADHAFAMGVLLKLDLSDPELLQTETGKVLHARYQAIKETLSWSNPTDPEFVWDIWFGEQDVKEPVFRSSIWDSVIESAEEFNDPGRFTAFIGYEWTSERPLGRDGLKSNYHRVLIFKDGKDKVGQVLPFTRNDGESPQELWQYMSDYQEKTGGEVLAIPHGGNVSDGKMFALTDYFGNPLSRSYAETRTAFEPLFEVTQIKGDGETHPLLSAMDEFADFETWNGWENDIERRGLDKPQNEWSEEEKRKKVYEYARSALKLGLQQESELGVNPFKFGMIGSSDAHTSLAMMDENNYGGRNTIPDERYNPERIDRWFNSAAGYAGVWAEQNTRESLFAAMKRKEVYATTGPRITLRFFGGWDFQPDDALRPDFATIGYIGGVPMGGDLTNAPAGKSPVFLIRAVKDPDGANLDRVQVVKGWHSVDGNLYEKVYDVALSDGRDMLADEKVATVGSTVDVGEATYTNKIGDPELAVVWEDPEFSAQERAFYYVRVIEIPTPRWTAYDAKSQNLNNVSEEIPMVIQERAYSSPIWYTP